MRSTGIGVWRAAAVAGVVGGALGVGDARGAVIPQLRGVWDPGGGQALVALWGYSNGDGAQRTVPLGSNNLFNPPPISRGQPTVFQPGTVYAAFTTTMTGPQLTWRLGAAGGTTVDATADVGTSPRLPVDPAILLGGGEIVPFVSRTWSTSATDHFAAFGYASGLGGTATIELGSKNLFTTPPPFPGQLTQFAPGIYTDVFTVEFSGDSITWSLTSSGATRTATAYAAPVPEPVLVAPAAVMAAVAGGRRRRLGT